MMTTIQQQESASRARRASAGNQSARAYPSRTIVHAKLEMTEPGDHDEQEADAVANMVVSGGKIARKISNGGSGSSGIAVSPQMESQLSQLQGGGRQMPEGLRNMMESGFGQDFSQVRLHTDNEAANMSSSINARAFTLGNDIYFNQGQFSPNTSEGQKLMAHELTHVVQGTGKVGRQEESTPVKAPLKEQDKYLGLAKKMIKSTISVFDNISQEVGVYFWGSDFVNEETRERIKDNFMRIASEIDNLDNLLNNKNKTSLYQLNPNEAKVHEQETDGLCIGNEIWIRTEGIDESFRDIDGRIAEVIIHELSHALFNANDNAYFDLLFNNVEGWNSIKENRLETSITDEDTADSYSSVAYLSYYTPYILTNGDFKKNLALITNNTTNSNELDAKGQMNYKNIFSDSSQIKISNPYFKSYEINSFKEFWETKMELIKKANSIDDIKKINPDLNNDKLYDIYEYKYQELLKKLMKNQLKAEEFSVLYWLAIKGDTTSEDNKQKLRELVEQHLQNNNN